MKARELIEVLRIDSDTEFDYQIQRNKITLLFEGYSNYDIRSNSYESFIGFTLKF